VRVEINETDGRATGVTYVAKATVSSAISALGRWRWRGYSIETPRLLLHSSARLPSATHAMLMRSCPV
jgi:hypothetical protein